GLLTAAVFLVGINIMVRRNPALAPMPATAIPMRVKLRTLRNVWGIAVLFVLVIGGISGGVFVRTDAGAVGAVGAFLIVVLKGRARRDVLAETLRDSVVTSAAIFTVLIGGMLFARFLTYTGLVGAISDQVLALGLPPA